ncbi:MAG: cyclic lactone autoinducer peptide [Clostridia bacterium]|nr:cyclic lactone autoinducer peptide [Clostridia bacterium]
MRKWLVKLVTILISLMALANVASASTILTYQPDVPDSLLKRRD